MTAPHAELPMWRGVDRDVARRACAAWNPRMDTLAHVANHGSSVWTFRSDGRLRYLRITHPAHRTTQDNASEVALVRHLAARNAPVACPVAAADGRWVVDVPFGARALSACVFEEAPGTWVPPERWTPTLLHTWGRTLGTIHAAARDFDPPAPVRRFTWEEEHLLARANEYLWDEDDAVREELALLRRHLASLRTTRETFGMTHADFAPQNFRVDEAGGITAFDFGNACWHWFVSDVAISISVLRRRPDRDALRGALVDGYRDVMALSEEQEAEIPWFLRLRAVYVVLSRRFAFGRSPTADQRTQMEAFRSRVGPQAVW